MKKLISLLVILLIMQTVLFAQSVAETTTKTEDNVLTVYAYDSFCGDWGAGPSIVEAFEKETGIKVDLVSAGDAIEMLNKVILEGDKCKADVVLGLTDDIAEKGYQFLESYSSPALESIADEIEFDPEHRLIPFDYGTFAFVYDSEADITKPESLMDLTKDEYKGKVILIDPRTSSVGMGLLLWTYNVFGDDYLSWWEKMKDNALTIASGWSAAYGLFTEGEAPIVLSYTTSPVYHVLYEDTTRFQALVFEEGHQATIEGLGVMKTSDQKDEARKFIDFVLSSGQVDIAIANSMYPANSAVELPDAFDWAPMPEKMFKSGQVGEEKTQEILKAWTDLMTK